MSVTSGFFNSLNHDRLYDATQMSQIFDGIIRDGVYESIGSCFVVNADGSLYVTVGTGRAWFNHTWIYNDAILPLALTDEYAPEVLTNRYDAVILDIDSSPDVRADSIMIVKGTPSSEIDFRNYVPGTVPESITLINEENHHQYPIAIIERPASQTEIRGSEIHNMVGTDYCPFVTGILEVTSADKFFKEWASELTEFVSDQESSFASWSAYQKQEFLTWAAASRTDFDNWSADTKAAFELWMDTEKADFDAWYANLQIQLSGQVATNLQRQISDLERDKLDVSRYEAEIGDTDYSQLGSTITEALMNSGGSRVQVTLEKKDGVTITDVICTISQGDYSLSADMSAINTVEFSGFRELTPITVTVNFKMDGQPTFVTKDIEVSCYKKYEVSFKLGGGSIWDGWLEAGGIEKEFDSIDDIMADSQAVNILFSNHGSVDWIVAYCENDPTAFDYFKDNETARKAIAKYDYTWEKIGEISGARRYLLAQSDWERYLPDHVPTMTSNTAPSGNVTRESIYDSRFESWQAFDNNDSTGWQSQGKTSPTKTWIQYEFDNPIKVNALEILHDPSKNRPLGETKLLGSNDGFKDDINVIETWNSDSIKSNELNKYTFDNNKYYKYYRLETIPSSNSTAANYAVYIMTLQFYGRSLIGVPTMTSNTTPEGEAIGGTELVEGGVTYHRYLAFDKAPNTFFASAKSADSMNLGYDFAKNIRIKFLTMTNLGSSPAAIVKSFDLLGFDGEKWETIEENVSNPNVSAGANVVLTIDNDKSYSKYKINCTPVSATNIGIAELNFFGQDLTDPHLKYSDGLSASTLLQKARWTGTAYSSMDDLLADETAVRQVFTVHDSSDYFVQNIEANPSALDPFLLNRFACKWIGLRDYVCDKLLAIEAAAEKLLTNETEFTLSDGTVKKGWEYILKDKVPVMTSNKAPYGVASAYQVFDNNASTSASGTDFSYKFVNPTCVKKFTSNIDGGILQVSNDGSTWNEADDGYYLYARVHYSASVTVHTIQFYGRSLNVSVPKMTGKTAPYGEVKSRSSDSTYSDWKAFDGDDTTYFQTANGGENLGYWLDYKFSRPVCIKNAFIKSRMYNSARQVYTYQILGSNTGNDSDYTPIGTMGTESDKAIQDLRENFENNESYLYYRILSLVHNPSARFSVYTIQLYGVDYSEKEFEAGSNVRYIYDHGLKIETISNFGAGGYSEKAESILVDDKSTTAYTLCVSELKDLTPYKLERVVVGNSLSGNVNLGVSVNNTGGWIANYKVLSAIDSPYNNAYDISNFNGDYYTGITTEGNKQGTVEITEWWLE